MSSHKTSYVNPPSDSGGIKPDGKPSHGVIYHGPVVRCSCGQQMGISKRFRRIVFCTLVELVCSCGKSLWMSASRMNLELTDPHEKSVPWLQVELRSA